MSAFVWGQGTRIAMLTLAILLLAHATVASPTLFARGALMLGSAAASLSAAVPANPYNTLAEELALREAELDRREAALRSDASAGDTASFSEQLAPYSLAASGLLFTLLTLNFFLDWRGRRGDRYRISLR